MTIEKRFLYCDKCSKEKIVKHKFLNQFSFATATSAYFLRKKARTKISDENKHAEFRQKKKK